MPVYEEGSYCCYGRILSRVPVTHLAFPALMQKFECLNAEFVAQGRTVRKTRADFDWKKNFGKPVLLRVQELEDLVSVRVKLKGTQSYHISASPFSVDGFIKLQKLEWSRAKSHVL